MAEERNAHLGAVSDDPSLGLSVRLIREYDVNGRFTINPAILDKDAVVRDFHKETKKIRRILRKALKAKK